MEEVGNMKSKMLWAEVTRSDASWHRAVSVTRDDTNKGSEENPEIRCRRGARDFRSADNLFAPTSQWDVEAADVACGGQFFFARPARCF